MPVGETVFRPSSRADHLTATVKLTAHGPLLHVDILEKDKPSPAELGAYLWIGRGEIARDCARGASRGWSRVGASLWIGRVESDASKQGDRFDDLDEILYRYVEPLVENMREVTHASAHARTRVHTRAHAHAHTRTHARTHTQAKTDEVKGIFDMFGEVVAYDWPPPAPPVFASRVACNSALQRVAPT